MDRDTGKILVVDDNEDILSAARLLLKQHVALVQTEKNPERIPFHMKNETWDVILDWDLGYLDGNAVKYLSRWRLKGGVQDLKKAAHYIQKLIEVEEANGNPGK